MSQLTGYGQYFGAVALLLFVLGLIGLSTIVSLGAQKVLSVHEVILLTPVIGLAVITVPVTILASYEIAISSAVVWILVGLFIGSAVVISVIRQQLEEIREVLVLCCRKLHLWILGVFVGFIPYYSLFLKEGFPVGFGTSATWTNNDLGAYVQMATNVGEAGIADAGLVTGWNAGLQASFDHPGSHALFAAVGRILHREPYQIGLVLMALILCLMFLAAVAVIGRIAKREPSISVFLAAVVVVVNPPLIAATTNFFYPHLASIALTICFLALLLAITEADKTRGAFVILGLLTVATWLISIEIAAVMITLSSLFVISQRSKMDRLSLLRGLILGHLVVFLAGSLIRFTLLRSQFDVLTRMPTSGVAGWKTNFASPSMLLGLVPTQFGGPYSQGVRFWDVLFVIAVMGLLVIAVVKKLIHPNVLGGVTAFGFSILVAIQKWGIDGYQTWKLITTLTPFIFILLVVVFLSLSKIGSLGSLVLVPLLTVGASYSWSGSIWNDSSASFLSQELSQITHTEEIQRQVGLNVLIEPFFRTMSASVMSGVPTRMSSPNYYFFEGQELLYRCTLATEETLKSIKNPGPIIARRGHYVLVGTPACD